MYVVIASWPAAQGYADSPASKRHTLGVLSTRTSACAVSTGEWMLCCALYTPLVVNRTV